MKTTSACPSPQAFNEQFEDGKTNFVVTISSQLRAPFHQRVVAKDIALESGKDVHVFDSKSASAGELLVSLKIKELVEQKLDKAEIINAVKSSFRA
jgi:fatty acid-binding protein DegV